MTDPMAVDLTQSRELVDRAIRAAVAPGQLVERRIRPESAFSWQEPAPGPGLRAALTVAQMAERRAHEYAVKLRGEGTSWAKIADLLDVPYSDDYARHERAYELVLGPAPESSSAWDQRSVHWRCGGPLGCGQLVIDRGPYNGHPLDNERGHAEDCRRVAAEEEAYRRDSEERERRFEAQQAAYEQVTDAFDRETVQRCWKALRRGGQIPAALSHGEQLAMALVLGDDEYLKRENYTRASAIRRVYDSTPQQVRRRLALLRQAATGETS